MSFKEFIKALGGDRVEGEIVKTIFYSLFTSLIFLTAIYYIKLREIDNLVPKYGFYLFFAALSYALITPTMRQVRAYKELPCMHGMMIGMSVGMISGFLPGFYVASTNGMFVGSFFGVAIGLFLGIWTGKCCGVMGVLEGIMAGFMGGLMGAMTAFMLLNDHLKITGVLVFLISSIVMFGLNYMIYKGVKESPRQVKESHFFTIVLTFLLMAATTWFIIFGPRTGIFGN